MWCVAGQSKHIFVSIYLSAYLLYVGPSLSLRMKIHLPIFPSVYLSSCLSVYLPLYLSVYLRLFLSSHSFIQSSTNQSIRLRPKYQSDNLSVILQSTNQYPDQTHLLFVHFLNQLRHEERPSESAHPKIFKNSTKTHPLLIQLFILLVYLSTQL